MLRRTLPFFALAALFAACANAPIDDETESDATAKSSSSSSTSSSGGTKDAATAKDTGASSSSSSSSSSGSSGSDASVVDVVVVPDSAATNVCPSARDTQNALVVGLTNPSPKSCSACIPLVECCFGLGGKDYCVPNI